MASIDPTFWLNRRVLVTGHTGFKGAWLCAILNELGADVIGIAHPPTPDAPLFEQCGIARHMESMTGDIRDADLLRRTIATEAPEIIFHLAAQSLVRRGLKNPRETFETNIQGTVNLLDAAREAPGLKAIVVVTSDKCYREPHRPCTEDDPLGGLDPYAASKACAEIVTEAYRHCFLGPIDGIGLATARAGNVIGSGDFNRDRLLPDLVRGIAAGRTVEIRNPHAIRPWQHVLDALHGYLLLAQGLARDPHDMGRAWNFGPSADSHWTVGAVADAVSRQLGGEWLALPSHETVETPVLRLDSSRSRQLLGWEPRLDIETALEWTVEGYRALETGDRTWLQTQIRRFLERPAATTAPSRHRLDSPSKNEMRAHVTDIA